MLRVKTALVIKTIHLVASGEWRVASKTFSLITHHSSPVTVNSEVNP
jgi:hypothetical protein